MYLTLQPLSSIPFISHGFTIRKFAGEHEFDLNPYTSKQPGMAEKNLALLAKSISVTSTPLITCRQVHGNNIFNVDLQKTSPQKIKEMQGDGLVTNQPNVTIAILTADCLPILLVDKKQRAIGAVHAGRKGTDLSVVEMAIEKMKILFGSSPENIIAGIGPGIKKCCYEVDLFEANTQQMIKKGVPEQNIFSLNQCTSCRNDLFFSYRAEKGETGRMIGFITIKN